MILTLISPYCNIILQKSKVIIPQATPWDFPWFLKREEKTHYLDYLDYKAFFFFLGLIVFCLNKFVNEYQLRDANGSELESTGPSRS